MTDLVGFCGRIERLLTCVERAQRAEDAAQFAKEIADTAQLMEMELHLESVRAYKERRDARKVLAAEAVC